MSGKKGKARAEPVHINLTISDCMDCPFVDADESYTACGAENGAERLAQYRRPDQIITPPKDCPFREPEGDKDA